MQKLPLLEVAEHWKNPQQYCLNLGKLQFKAVLDGKTTYGHINVRNIST